MIKSFWILFFVVASISLSAQDTLKIMQYNLLNYGKYSSYCTESNNNIDDKNTYLSTILDYAKPDIFCVNEMDASVNDVDYLMDQVLNVNGVSTWQRAAVSGNYLINMLYYNSEKYSLVSQVSVPGDPRQVDVYTMALVSDNSIQFTLFVAHLKASYGAEEEARRAETTQNVMNYIASEGVGNYLIMGDFNMYTSEEDGFQNLINPSIPDIAFNDPVNRLGDWNNNSSFSDVHTQSTHTSGGCFAGGGMDDRFDFILISDPVLNGTSNVQYIPNSYETIGQDGNHFNDNVNDGNNNSAPSNVISALYNMSDHLPISLELKLNSDPSGTVSVTVFNKTFDDQDLSSGGWQQFSVTDESRKWNIPTNTYGHNDTYYCKMTGWDYDNSIAIDNEDWLISPSFNANQTSSEVLTFWTSSKYSGPDIHAYYSVDYTGEGNPNDATWIEFADYNISTTTDYTWESSGDIDLSTIEGENVHIAFKYTSDPNLGARTWQVDDIKLVGETQNNSIAQKNKSLFRMYPNPVTNGLLQLEIDASYLKEHMVGIYNASGQLVEQHRVTQSKIISLDVSGLEAGIYFVKLGYDVQKLIID